MYSRIISWRFGDEIVFAETGHDLTTPLLFEFTGKLPHSEQSHPFRSGSESLAVIFSYH
jgi:hypothetical protein